ncbi:hypothetical protein ACIQGZ_00850 [Streptomyces sp. NPDC092296]|uniref:hypothetical protein n=1 Tax=Streptomyces sp. NPDC092296 TaxID=3366012 RepID=UPI00382EB26F
MPSRRLLAMAALAVAVLPLTSCASGDADASGSTTTGPTTSPPTTAAAAPAAASPTAAVSDLPLDPEPTFDCTAAQLPAGHRVVQVTAAPVGGVLRARRAEFACDPDGGDYAGTGAAADYRLAAGATAELSTGATTHQAVTLAALTGHLAACLAGKAVPEPFSCSGNLYEITGDSGGITRFSEVWHP